MVFLRSKLGPIGLIRIEISGFVCLGNTENVFLFLKRSLGNFIYFLAEDITVILLDCCHRGRCFIYDEVDATCQSVYRVKDSAEQNIAQTINFQQRLVFHIAAQK